MEMYLLNVVCKDDRVHLYGVNGQGLVHACVQDYRYWARFCVKPGHSHIVEWCKSLYGYNFDRYSKFYRVTWTNAEEMKRYVQQAERENLIVFDAQLTLGVRFCVEAKIRPASWICIKGEHWTDCESIERDEIPLIPVAYCMQNDDGCWVLPAHPANAEILHCSDWSDERLDQFTIFIGWDASVFGTLDLLGTSRVTHHVIKTENQGMTFLVTRYFCDAKIILLAETWVRKSIKMDSYTITSWYAKYKSVASVLDEEEWSDVPSYIPNELLERLRFCCDKICFLASLLELCRACGTLPGETNQNFQGYRIQSCLAYFNTEFAIPNLRNNWEACGKYMGAAVLDPVIGYYEAPVDTLDFASMYPSIMIAHNLCPSTLILTPEDATVLGNLAKLMPNGYSFFQGAKGVYPRLLEHLLTQRAVAKAAMKKFPALKAVYDARQLAFKTLANSVYGVCGSMSYDIPCLEVSSAVTAQGRDDIHLIKALVEHHWPAQPSRVLYGDTDSVMVHMSELTLPDALEFGRRCAAHVTKYFIPPCSLAFEKVYWPYILLGKKRYAGVWWDSPNQPTKTDAKGLSLVKRTSTELTRKGTRELLTQLLHDDVREWPRLRELLTLPRPDNLTLSTPSIGIFDLALTQQFSKPTGRLAHDTVARATEREIGERIHYFVGRGKGPIKDRALAPAAVMDIEDLDLVHYTRIAHREHAQIAAAAKRSFNKWNTDDLIAKKRQKMPNWDVCKACAPDTYEWCVNDICPNYAYRPDCV
jgi:hypothetical protein